VTIARDLGPWMPSGAGKPCHHTVMTSGKSSASRDYLQLVAGLRLAVSTGSKRAGPIGLHVTTRYANNGVEADHGPLKAWLRPMRGLKRFPSARIVAAGHAFVQNLRRGHYQIAVHTLPSRNRLLTTFDELAIAL
jgi:DDE domain